MHRIKVASLLCCSLLYAPGFARFSEIALERDGIISPHHVSVGDQPAKMFEWRFDVPQYCRLVVEERVGGDAVWKVRQSTSEAATKRATLTIMIVRGLPPTPAHKNDWLIDMFWGAEYPPAKAWSSRDAWIPALVGDYDLVWSKCDPNEVLLLRTKTVEYRVRIEASADPFK
jgi:hypothetical protein